MRLIHKIFSQFKIIRSNSQTLNKVCLHRYKLLNQQHSILTPYQSTFLQQAYVEVIDPVNRLLTSNFFVFIDRTNSIDVIFLFHSFSNPRSKKQLVIHYFYPGEGRKHNILNKHCMSYSTINNLLEEQTKSTLQKHTLTILNPIDQYNFVNLKIVDHNYTSIIGRAVELNRIKDICGSRL